MSAEPLTTNSNDPVDAEPLDDGIQFVGSSDISRDVAGGEDLVIASVVPPESKPADAVVVAEKVIDQPADPTRAKTLLFRALGGIGSMIEWLFGAVCMTVGLAFLATVPVLQLISLGILLEASGRVARSSKLREGFVDVRKAARIGGVVLGGGAMLLPLWFVSGLWYDAQLIDPAGGVATGWRIGQLILTILLMGNVVLASFCGGRLRHFFWPLTAPFAIALWIAQAVCRAATSKSESPPTSQFGRWLADFTRPRPIEQWWFVPAIILQRLKEGKMYATARDGLWEFVVGLRLPYYFWLGLRGFIGAVAWLFLPVSLLAVATSLPPVAGVLSGLLGGFLLTCVLVYLPFLQTNFAAQRRFSAMFNLWQVHSFYRRSPFAFFFALLITLAGALPLYLLKIEATPSEVAWLPSLVFVAFIFPARLLTGWAVGRAQRREPPRFILFNVASHLFAFPGVPIAAIFALLVFVTQYVSWYGALSLYEQHAFLVPVPMLGG